MSKIKIKIRETTYIIDKSVYEVFFLAALFLHCYDQLRTRKKDMNYSHLYIIMDEFC